VRCKIIDLSADGAGFYEAGIVSKWLQMLKEIATHVTRVALVGNRKTTAFSYVQRAAEAAAPSIRIELIAAPVVATVAEIEHMFQSLASMSNGGSWCCPTRLPLAIASSLSRWPLGTALPPSTRFAS
jgi:hypothetical protein